MKKENTKLKFKILVLITVIQLFLGKESLFAQDTVKNCFIDVLTRGALVSPICRGQQIEEFNHQFEGGLYAQLINNPSFEEVNNPIANWEIVKMGSSSGTLTAQNANDTRMLNTNQEHCVKLTINSITSGSVGIANAGYWGIKLENSTKYKVSFWAKRDKGFKGKLSVKLESKTGIVYAQSPELKLTKNWQHFTFDLVTNGITDISGDNRFVIYATSTGEVYFDVVTVMPPTWKNRPNGLRPDLAEKLNALNFEFIQFPGGCMAESASVDTSWNWKNSVGPIEKRAGSTRHRWGYKNDHYFGLDEHFQLCEDLGAEPIYTTSAGISETPWNKEWFKICPIDQMQPIVDDILDLLEYCNGAATTIWGGQRALNGHPEPYNLRYIEIGNENGWGTEAEYSERYAMIRKAVLSKYPDMKIMYNGYRQMNAPSRTFGNEVDYTDEHFYLPDLSVLYNKYDTINAECKKICVAEYASSVKGNGGDIIGNFGDALSDAAFMLGCEKNSERMWWTGYGNYAGILGHSNFGPCLVWNDAVSSFATPSYYMQKMLFTDNQGSQVLPFSAKTDSCFWSVTSDTVSGKNDVLIKVVNKSNTLEEVSIQLTGAGKVNPVGHSSFLTGDIVAENSLQEPHKIIPVTGTFSAGANFRYTFPANSITVLRVSLLQN